MRHARGDIRSRRRFHQNGRLVFERTEGLRDLGRSRKSALAVLRHRAQHERIETARQAPPESAWGGRLDERDLVDHGERAGGLERMPAGGSLVEQDTQREEIRAGIEWVSTGLLGRHVGDRARDRADFGEVTHGCGWRGRARPSVQPLGESEIDHLRAPRAREQYVGRLHVAMDETKRVRCVERVRHVRADPDHLFKPERAAGEMGPQRLTFHELHRDELIPIRLLDLVNSRDVGMVQCGGKLGFADESLAPGAGFQRFTGEDLQRDITAQSLVVRAIDGAHAADAEPLRDTVARDSLSDLDVHTASIPDGSRVASDRR